MAELVEEKQVVQSPPQKGVENFLLASTPKIAALESNPTASVITSSTVEDQLVTRSPLELSGRNKGVENIHFSSASKKLVTEAENEDKLPGTVKDSSECEIEVELPFDGLSPRKVMTASQGVPRAVQQLKGKKATSSKKIKKGKTRRSVGDHKL